MKRGLQRIISIIVFLLLSSLALSQEEIHWDIVDRIREEGSDRSKVDEYIWTLTELHGPRWTASPNMRAAQDWVKTIIDQMELENTALEPWGGKYVSWDLEYVSIHMLEPDYQMVIGYPIALTRGTKRKITQEAMIVNIQQKADLDKYKGKLKNKIILVSPIREYAPRFEADALRHDENSLNVYATEGVDINMAERRKQVFMKRSPRPKDINNDELEAFYKAEGVKAVLYSGTGGDGTVRVTSRQTRKQDRTNDAVRNSLPMLAITGEHYNRVYRLLEKKHTVKMEINVRVKLGNTELEGRNVVGEIRGSDLADEIVMIGAHLDSYHTGTGAADNASGSAVVLEAMRILKSLGLKPRRTIRMALWTGEEWGFFGSRGYVAKHFGNPDEGKKSAYDKLSVYFNMDNGTGQFRGIHLQGHTAASPILEAWMKPFQDLKMKTLSQFSNTGTDHYTFVKAGLPGFQFLQDRIDYRTRTWHYNMDVYDHIVVDDLKINAIVLASFAYHAAMRDKMMPRIPFKRWKSNFSKHQPELFKDGGSLTNAFADYDNDGDLDLFVGFKDKPNRLYRNNNGAFENVADQVGLADSNVTRTAAWGDYDGDGHVDLFVGFVSRNESSNKLYRNEGDGKSFTDVTRTSGVNLTGSFRQASWVDYDNDGDLDLFIGLRNKPNVLLQNTGGNFKNMAKQLDIDDARRTVGAVWFDYDKDGDLDCYVANMDGDANGLFRNDGSKFVDIAKEVGLESGGRPLGSGNYGSVRPSLGDYDNDGNLDIFLANYGPNGLYRNINGRNFKNVAPELGLAIDNRYDTGSWGDYDNNGRLDLYVNGTITGGKSYEDYLFHNDASGFTNITPKIIKDNDGDHGAHWVDFDQDGDLDLALTGASSDGMHHLLRNEIAEELAQQSLQVVVLDGDGHYTRSGSEVRLYKAGTKQLLGMNILDTGSGYNSQNAMPVHFGLRGIDSVDIEVTVMTNLGRKSVLLNNVDPKKYLGTNLIVKINAAGKRVN